jgi:hypothetical protein
LLKHNLLELFWCAQVLGNIDLGGIHRVISNS